MNKIVISLLTILIMIFGVSALLSSTGVKIGTPKIAPAGPYNVGDLITFSVPCWAQKDIALIKIVGGVEGQTVIYDETHRNWTTGIKKTITFKWKPTSGGSFVLYAEIDPDNKLGYKERITIKVDIQQASPGVTLYEMPKPTLTQFQEEKPNNKKRSKFTVVEPDLTNLPDLIVTNIKVTPSLTQTEHIVKVEATIKNTAKSLTPPDKMFWISSQIDKKNDKTTNFLGLGEGEERIAEYTYSFPLNVLNEGIHEVVLFADSSRLVQEADENNNTKSVKFNIDTHTNKIMLNDWYFSGLGNAKIDDFASQSDQLILNLVFSNNGKLPFSGKLISYGFENPETGGTAKNNIPANIQLNIPPNGSQSVQIPKIQPSFFMGMIQEPQENVKLLYSLDFNISGKSEPKTFTYVIPDLIVIPERYSVQCPIFGEPKMQVYGKIRNEGRIPEGKTITLRVNWQRWIKGEWGKAGEMKNEEKLLYYKTPLANTYFTVEGIEGDSWFTTSGGRVMNICFEIDYQDNISEINENNNRVCGRLIISSEKNECSEQSNKPFKAQ